MRRKLTAAPLLACLIVAMLVVPPAAGAVPRFGRRAFLTIGVQDLGAFAGLADIWFLVRLIDKPAGALPLADYRIITGRGPFTAAAERSLMEDHRVEMLVTKASGGAATAAKLDAARYLGMPVIMVCRPPVAPGTTVCDVSAALAWIRDGLRT